MAFDYSGLKATAERLIARFGQSATLVKTTTSGPDYDPTTTTSESDITLVETDYSMTNRNETLVQAGDKIWIVSTDGLEPKLEDKIKLGGVTYYPQDVQPLNPGGTTLMFTVHARK